MKILNVKTIFMVIFLSLFITSCTDIISEDDYPQDNTEIVTNSEINATGGSGNGEDGGEKGD